MSHGTSTGPTSAPPGWDVVITEWALDSYLNLKHAQVFTDQEYWATLRPDVELLRTGIPSAEPKFQSATFWGPAKQAGPRRGPAQDGEIQDAHEPHLPGPIHVSRQAMTLFKTTADQVLNLASIMVEMKNVGLDHEFIVKASVLARTDQGIYDLMALWLEASAAPERDEIIADIQDSIDDYADAPQEPVHKPYIKYDRLADVAQRVMADKVKLRQLIDQHGGVSAVAQKSGIPQPSLSRMLNSPSIPRRSTLYKIANALDLPETEIVTEWSR